MIPHSDRQLRFVVANEMQHAVLLAGVPEAAPVLLIHGLGWDHALWAALVDPLVAAGYRVIAPDLRGMGRSDKPNRPYSVDLYRRDLAAMLDVFGIGDLAVVGFSLGGMIAAALACADRRVVGLVLACCTLHSEPAAERATEAMLARAQRDGPLIFAQAQADAIWAPQWAASHPDVVADFIHRRSAMDQPALHRAFRASYGVDLRAICGALCLPALVMAAQQDAFVSEAMARAVADAIPGADYQLFQAGHMLPIERPQAFEESVRTFLNNCCGNGLRSGSNHEGNSQLSNKIKL